MLAGSSPARGFILIVFYSQLQQLAFYFAPKKGGDRLKQTKNAGLVSCGLEEYLINKLDRETSKKKHKKFESEVLKEKQLMDKLMAK